MCTSLQAEQLIALLKCAQTNEYIVENFDFFEHKNVRVKNLRV